MTHYVCLSCGGVDTTPHECRTGGCEHQGQPLTECDRDDPNSHKKATRAEEKETHESNQSDTNRSLS